jgi:hypothetical protein
MDGPMPGYVTINMLVEIEPNAFIIRHTHPGIESSYVLEGGLDLPIQGQPTRAKPAKRRLVSMIAFPPLSGLPRPASWRGRPP